MAAKKPSAAQTAAQIEAIGETKPKRKAPIKVADLGFTAGPTFEDVSKMPHYRLANEVATEKDGVTSWKCDIMFLTDTIAKVTYAGAKRQITVSPVASTTGSKDAVQLFVKTAKQLLPQSKDAVNDLVWILFVNGEKALTPHNRWLLVKEIPGSQPYAMNAALVAPAT